LVHGRWALFGDEHFLVFVLRKLSIIWRRLPRLDEGWRLVWVMHRLVLLKLLLHRHLRVLFSFKLFSYKALVPLIFRGRFDLTLIELNFRLSDFFHLIIEFLLIFGNLPLIGLNWAMSINVTLNIWGRQCLSINGSFQTAPAEETVLPWVVIALWHLPSWWILTRFWLINTIFIQ
jgi:hypothetical protein